MQRKLLLASDKNFGVVLQQSSVDVDCMATVVVHLDTPAQQHELQEIKSQVFCHLCLCNQRCHLQGFQVLQECMAVTF